MSDYLDKEAEESDDEEELDEVERKRLKKIRDESEDEEDDEEQYAEELRDFIADTNVDSEESEGEGVVRRRKRTSGEREELDDQLEDDDYDLLEENLGIKVQRQKKFRRVRVEEESDEEQEAMEESAASVMVDAAAEASDEEATREDLDLTNEQDEERARRSGGSDQEDELDDFIVDEEGNPVRDKRKKVKRNHIPDSALQDAQDIFGVEFDYDDMEQVSGEEGGDEEGVEGEEDEYYSDEEREEGEDGDRSSPARKKRRVGKKGWRRKVPKTTIFDLFEPADLERNHFTDLDNDLRNSDIPERMQIRNFPVTPADAQDGDRELEEESEWIYRNAFSVMPVSKQTIRPEASMKESKLVQPILGASTTSRKIKNALEFMRNMYLEVPFIANYRKEYVEGLTSNDLWRIYDFDEKWCQLKSRKEKLCELMQSMMTYQQDMCVERSDEPLPEDFRAVCVTDVQRTMQAETPEEFNDAYSQFLMYYSHEVPNMHDYRRRKRTEQRRKEREALQAERLQKKHTKTVIVSKTVVNDDTGEMTTVDVAEEVTDDERVMEEKEKEVVEEDEEEEEEPEQLKAPARRHPYNLCRRAGLAGFASLFGLAPDRFAENVRDEYARHEPESSPVEPLEAAKQYVCAQFPQVEDVVKAATLMVAHQLAAEPDVRRAIRTKVYNGATVNVRPTKKGFREIDENHALYRYKYLNGKAVSSLENELFLVLEGGEKDGLITLELNCDVLNKDGVRLSEEVETLYVQDGFAQYVKSWNEVRRNTIRQMFARILIPLMEKELRRRLGDEAREHVVLSAARKLYDSIKVAPYRPPDAKDDDDENWDCTAGIRVLGLSYVANEPDLAAFAVVIDMNAEVLDKLRLPAIMRGRGRQNQVPEKKANAVQHTFANDLQNLRQLIIKHKPHVVAMAAESRAAQQLGSELETVLAELRTSHGFPEVTVEFVDNSLAKIYGNSLRGAEEFPEYPMVLRQAVSLARRIQNPLLEFAQLCTFDDEILCVPWHSMQDQGGRDALLAALQHEFITRVNNVGVDLNECAASPYVAQVLQFVCGLGPRKAAAVLKTLRQKTIRMENRTQLVTQLHMGPRLFMNVAGFIRIDTNSLGDSADNYVELLDSTRVHPETYEWARKMAIDALEYDEVGYDANPGAALEEILESPDRLKDLDLEAFAVELERQGYGNKKITLPDIRVELTNRYADHREEYKSPGEDELFAWFTKETPDTLHPGRLQLGHVVGIAHRKHNARGDDLQQQQQPTRLDSGLWRCQFCLRSDFPELSEVWTHLDLGQCPGRAVGVRLRLENGIPGFIPIKNLSDSEVLNPMDRVYVGMVIQVVMLHAAGGCEEVGGRLVCIDACDVKKPGHYDFTIDFQGSKLDLSCVAYKGLKRVKLFKRTFCRGRSTGMEDVIDPWDFCFFKQGKQNNRIPIFSEKPKTDKTAMEVIKEEALQQNSLDSQPPSLVPEMKMEISTSTENPLQGISVYSGTQSPTAATPEQSLSSPLAPWILSRTSASPRVTGTVLSADVPNVTFTPFVTSPPPIGSTKTLLGDENPQIVDAMGGWIPLGPTMAPIPKTTEIDNFSKVMNDLGNISRVNISAEFADGTIVHAVVPSWLLQAFIWLVGVLGITSPLAFGTFCCCQRFKVKKDEESKEKGHKRVKRESRSFPNPSFEEEIEMAELPSLATIQPLMASFRPARTIECSGGLCASGLASPACLDAEEAEF
ncbi:unnamed protein product [Notodromas monacha]|uniref:Suppressor of Ty 6 homolog n=1 Tax=Notodromas monacha TaxID=399045 RepID=A0A7R9GII9_9CRUS|nr:unnamed protein product [Notodromas monacha]CAG0922503.1 unnamed protein product [Notodromas monacha]